MMDKDKCVGGVSIHANLHITQAGKSRLYELQEEAKQKRYKVLVDWMHIALTAVAVIISIIALAKP